MNQRVITHGLFCPGSLPRRACQPDTRCTAIRSCTDVITFQACVGRLGRGRGANDPRVSEVGMTFLLHWERCA